MRTLSHSRFLLLGLLVAAQASADPDADLTASTIVSSRYDRSVIARPLTLPANLLSVGADAGGNHDLSFISGAPIAGYGITDRLEVQVPYVFAARDFEARGSLSADAGYAFLRGALDGKLECVARIRGGYNSLDKDAAPLMVGVHVQYNITPKIAVISGAPGTQQIRFTLAENPDGSRPIDVSLPLGIGVQPTRTVYLQLDTKLAQFNLHDSANAMFGTDTTPVSLTAVWNALPQLDLQAAIGTDLSHDLKDSMTFLVGARYYAGQL